ncbi:MAG: hypothetical protein ACRDSH_15340 [Pseudonocardiaceae bacterium]
MNDQQDPGATCPHDELAVGWGLHALEPAGASLVAVHLPGCVMCTHTAAETEKVGATLGLSLPTTVPSATLEQRVLSIAAASRHTPTEPICRYQREAVPLPPWGR